MGGGGFGGPGRPSLERVRARGVRRLPSRTSRPGLHRAEVEPGRQAAEEEEEGHLHATAAVARSPAVRARRRPRRRPRRLRPSPRRRTASPASDDVRALADLSRRPHALRRTAHRVRRPRPHGRRRRDGQVRCRATSTSTGGAGGPGGPPVGPGDSTGAGPTAGTGSTPPACGGGRLAVGCPCRNRGQFWWPVGRRRRRRATAPAAAAAAPTNRRPGTGAGRGDRECGTGIRHLSARASPRPRSRRCSAMPRSCLQLGRAWNSFTGQFRDACYTDIYPLYYNEALSAGRSPTTGTRSSTRS